ncbi:uncharacterized protein LOC122038121 isoform X2 [Zingiber officinale]|uniref:uncharacterized protein LOC122038121 isoform X2 n=1 Tax=Zingiber officinale TaxID=94328 RepID=UPI001C4BCBAD|nr:uncharacterized protein LOC122038121 isoform X2 [Zingiber officinale]
MPCLRLPVPIAGTGAGVSSSSSFIFSFPNLFSFVDSRRHLRFPAIAAKARPNKRDKPLQKPLEVAGFEEETIEVDETEGRGEEVDTEAEAMKRTMVEIQSWRRSSEAASMTPRRANLELRRE